MEVEALVENGVGTYSVSQFLDQTTYVLNIESAEVAEEVHVGMTYFCAAFNEDALPVKSHWLYCTSVHPKMTFSIVSDHANPDRFTPALTSASESLVKHEELSDITAIFSSAAPEGSLAQAQIGKHGWLVSRHIHSPNSMGILVDNHTLPTAFCKGARNITLTARSKRTLQTICLGSLLCVNINDTALFLQQASK